MDAFSSLQKLILNLQHRCWMSHWLLDYNSEYMADKSLECFRYNLCGTFFSQMRQLIPSSGACERGSQRPRNVFFARARIPPPSNWQ